MPTAIYPGSLDPITFGHSAAIQDAAECFSKMVVAIGINPSKNYMFSLAEREKLAQQALAHVPNVSVTSFSGLLVHFLVRNNWNIVVRGLRNGNDLDDAMMQDSVGRQQTMARNIKALYVPTHQDQAFISSTILKAVLKEQGDARSLAPLSTIHATQARMMGQYFYGITGQSGSGKSNLCRKFAEIATRRNIPLSHIDMDKIAHGILLDEREPLYQKTRADIGRAFGQGVLQDDGSINRKALGNIVFADLEKMKVLNNLIHEPILFRMNDVIRGQKGAFVIDNALLAEINATSLVNNHALVVKAKSEDIAKRLNNRDGLSAEQLDRRASAQLSSEAKIVKINETINQTHYGQVQSIMNDDRMTDSAVERAFDTMLEQIDLFGELRITGFFKTLGLPNAKEAYHELRKLYTTDDRFYHALTHVVDGLNKMPDVLPLVENKNAFILAWLFHDAVYDTHAKDNEEASAALMQKKLKEWGLTEPDLNNGLVQSAKRLIMVTKHGAVEPVTFDEKLMADLDLSIFGSPQRQFDCYEQGTRREYQWVTPAAWVKGRSDFLRTLHMPYFYTDFFDDRYGATAEKNIARSLKRLCQTNAGPR